MVFARQKIKPVQPGNPLMSGDVDTEYWFTGKMMETRDKYEGIPTRKAKLNAELRGKEVTLIPEIRHLPSRKEQGASAFYSTREVIEGEQIEQILTRQEHYRKKGWLPLDECPEEIKNMVAIMHKHNKRQAETYLEGKEFYNAS